jgi:hypothetical protein
MSGTVENDQGAAMLVEVKEHSTEVKGWSSLSISRRNFGPLGSQERGLSSNKHYVSKHNSSTRQTRCSSLSQSARSMPELLFF